jgi:hypothetical protein
VWVEARMDSGENFGRSDMTGRGEVKAADSKPFASLCEQC